MTDQMPEVSAPAKQSAFSWKFLLAVFGVAGAVLFFIIQKPQFAGFGGGDGGTKVVVLDSARLVNAALAMSMTDKDSAIDSEHLGKLVAAKVDEYKRKGYVVIAAGTTVAFPSSADITPEIADEAGLDLAKADLAKKMLSGELNEAPRPE